MLHNRILRNTLAALVMVLILLWAAGAMAAGTDDYGVEVVANCWTSSSSMGGSSLYVPYLKVKVENKKSTSVSRVTVKVVFYDESQKSLWSDETSYLVSSSDSALQPGYSKTAFVKSSVGYRSQISTYSLPYITAEVYVNGECFGQVSVNRTYTESAVSTKLTGAADSGAAAITFPAGSDPFGVVVDAAYWTSNTGWTGQTLYVPYVKLHVTNQQSSPATRIQVKVVFMQDSDKSVLDDQTSYLISSGDTPLKTGYNKTAFLKADVGYKSQVTASRLPGITAEVYVNDVYYGKVSINKTYSEEKLNKALKPSTQAQNQSTVAVNEADPYLVTITANCWTESKGYGSTLYVPYLKVNVLNRSGKDVKSMKLKVVFYNRSEKVVWSDESAYVVSSSDSALRHGYSKSAFIKASVGYRSQISTYSLPNLVVEIYLDNKLIGEVDINNTYTETALNTTVTKKDTSAQDVTVSGTGDPYQVLVTCNCWDANTGSSTLYTPYLKLKVINQQATAASRVNVKVIFYNKAEKTVWSEESDYLVSSSDTPLKSGYGKVSFIRSSVGYRSKPSTSQLPAITAEVYINEVLYGEVDVTRSYDTTTVSVPLTKKTRQEEAAVTGTDGRDYGIQYTANCWTDYTGLDGTTLWVPYLKINVTNQKAAAADRIVVHVVFTEENKQEVWSDETDYLVSSSDSALKSGYSKTAFVRSSVGYKSKPSASSLPTITAKVYINDVLYDTVTINKTVGN